MGLKDLEVYWKHWALEEGKGRPFAFHTDKGKGREREEDGEEEDEEEEEGGSGGEEGHDNHGKDGQMDEEDEEERITAAPTPPSAAFAIDQGISLPCQCDSPAARTICLLQLALEQESTGKTFSSLVQKIDALEVSSTLILFLLSYIILGCGFSKWVSEFQVAICQMVMGYCPPFQGSP
jgi:hypothetical protein